MHIPPVFYFAILHARPTRRSPEAILVEISIPLGVRPISAVLPSNRLSSRGSVSDTTCTARSDCSDHECHLHSAVSYDGSLESPRWSHVQSTAHRKDARMRTYHKSSSIGGDTTKLQTALKGVSTQVRSTQQQLTRKGDLNRLLKVRINCSGIRSGNLRILRSGLMIQRFITLSLNILITGMRWRKHIREAYIQLRIRTLSSWRKS